MKFGIQVIFRLQEFEFLPFLYFDGIFYTFTVLTSWSTSLLFTFFVKTGEKTKKIYW